MSTHAARASFPHLQVPRCVLWVDGLSKDDREFVLVHLHRWGSKGGCPCPLEGVDKQVDTIDRCLVVHTGNPLHALYRSLLHHTIVPDDERLLLLSTPSQHTRQAYCCMIVYRFEKKYVPKDKAMDIARRHRTPLTREV